MKKIKNNKGITLVALIITIIVLLILAVVAISAVNGDGIISKAKLARENYQTAQTEENTILGNYLTTLNNVNNNENKDAGNDSIVGTYYLYDPENYNTVTLVLNADGTIGEDGMKILLNSNNVRNLKWSKDKEESNKILIEGEYEYEEKGSYTWSDFNGSGNIFNVSEGKCIRLDGIVFVSSLDCINNFSYLKDGKYKYENSEKTISSTTSGGYKFGLWTDSDGTRPYFTDGNIIINPFGEIYNITGEDEFTSSEDSTIVYRYVEE